MKENHKEKHVERESGWEKVRQSFNVGWRGGLRQGHYLQRDIEIDKKIRKVYGLIKEIGQIDKYEEIDRGKERKNRERKRWTFIVVYKIN